MTEKQRISELLPPVATPAIPYAPEPQRDNILRGITFALGAFSLFAIMQACGKLLLEQHHVAEIVFYRNLFALIPLIIYITAFRKWDILKTRKPGAMAFRALIGSISLLFTFEAFKYLPMADTTVLFFVGILLTPAMAFFFLKEYVGPHRWAAIIAGLVGVIIMMRPSADMAMIGVLVALGAAVLHSMVNVTLRYLKSESPVSVTFYFILSGAAISAPFMPFIAKMPGGAEWILFSIVGVSGLVGQYLLTSAFRHAPASLVAMFSYTGLLWATGFDIVIWHYMPGVNVFAGAAIILAANIYIIHRERLAELRALGLKK
ncbi:MAG: DMT family transporter [Alphaproteobacteria bacterium]